MTERFEFPNPVTIIYRHLVKKLKITVARDEVPAGYTGQTPLVLITNGGGWKVHTYQLMTGRISFEVRHPNAAKADELARQIWEYTRALADEIPEVYLPAGVPFPQYFPSDDPRSPAYVWTAQMTVKSNKPA
ncbi:MAG: hypothetical protein ACFNXW_00165 [Rothia dentocariosa]|uniref:hypothetical protein n=1 Tax=Rothia dentocariosa TaxID=2047 RepID=UPI002048EA56|nr:MAG TPA: hypothetical protein [Caudoviricetes sp.]